MRAADNVTMRRRKRRASEGVDVVEVHHAVGWNAVGLNRQWHFGDEVARKTVASSASVDGTCSKRDASISLGRLAR